MERLIIKKLLDWKNSPYRKPLILKGVFIAQYNYQKLQSEMENIASPKWRKLQRIF